MAGGLKLASKYSKVVDERWTKESQAALGLNNNYEFNGVDTVKVYSIPTVPMGNYTRSGANRYGTPADLTRNVQTMKVTRDRCATWIIDKGDKLQSQMVSDAGKSLSRQVREVCVPEYDAYVFRTQANAAIANGAYDDTAASKDNAYSLLLKGQEYLGDHNVPDKGRVAFCTYKFANLLKQDPAFMKYGNLSQEMVIKGVIGEVDGTKIVKVPASRLPAGAAFLLVHPQATTAPKQLDEYKIHDNPPGVSGWLVEMRLIYDCFVLNEKCDGLYFHGGQAVLKPLSVITAATNAGKTSIIVQAEKVGAKWYYMTAANAAGLTDLTYDTAITVSGWTELTANGLEITPTASHTMLRVVEVDSANKPLAFGDAPINKG